MIVFALAALSHPFAGRQCASSRSGRKRMHTAANTRCVIIMISVVFVYRAVVGWFWVPAVPLSLLSLCVDALLLGSCSLPWRQIMLTVGVCVVAVGSVGLGGLIICTGGFFLFHRVLSAKKVQK